jgi:hypothetical protein
MFFVPVLVAAYFAPAHGRILLPHLPDCQSNKGTTCLQNISRDQIAGNPFS